MTTGSLDGGPEDDALFQGALASARLHGIAHEVLDGAEVNARFPGYRMDPHARFVLQPQGGLIASERAIVAHVRAAQAAGADIRARERVLDWHVPRFRRGVVVQTDKGCYEAERLVLTAGAWIGELAAPLRALALPERQVLAWLQPLQPELFAPERFPVFNLSVPEGRYYGFPIYEVPGFKFGRYHHRGETMPAEAMRREVDAEDEALLRGVRRALFPGRRGARRWRCAPACSPILRMSTSLLTITPTPSRWCSLRPVPAMATNSVQ